MIMILCGAYDFAYTSMILFYTEKMCRSVEFPGVETSSLCVLLEKSQELIHYAVKFRNQWPFIHASNAVLNSIGPISFSDRQGYGLSDKKYLSVQS